MSTEWDKYTKPIETQTRNGNASEFGVVSFNVGKIREFLGNYNDRRIDVNHDPLPTNDDPTDNQSHSLIINIPSKNHSDYKEKRSLLNEIHLYLHENSKWELLDFGCIEKELSKIPQSKKMEVKLDSWSEFLQTD
ncbi:MAG: hypothetical protein OEY49_20065 [Candidatus Heimdallarchaeota archaeon]|nr:hypothetical protein [Candidatus Heimdallarchaeota archaeon]